MRISTGSAARPPGSRATAGLLDQLDPDAPGAVDARGEDPAAPRRATASPTSCASSRSSGTGRTYSFDFAFERQRTILETNGRRWHDDPADYERDNEKWSVPGRHGYKLVFATWDKVTRHPRDLIEELTRDLGMRSRCSPRADRKRRFGASESDCTDGIYDEGFLVTGRQGGERWCFESSDPLRCWGRMVRSRWRPETSRASRAVGGEARAGPRRRPDRGGTPGR